jgi:hypothetical protein
MDTKTFSFLAKTKLSYTIAVKAEGFMPYVRLLTPEGNLLHEARARAGMSEVLVEYRATLSGRIHVRVTADDKKLGKFRVTIQR